MSVPETSVAPAFADFETPLEMECGRTLARFTVAYETYGTLSAARDNAVLVGHPLSADAHAAGVHDDGRRGWWDDAVGPGRMLDTDRFFVVCCNVLGGSGGSTGPSSLDADGMPYGVRFPLVTVPDIVRAQTYLLDLLGVERLHAAIGGCFGGQQALTWAMLHPARVSNAIAIGTTPATSAHTIATFAVMRRLIMEDADWDEGRGTPRRGMAAAMAVAIPLWMGREPLQRKFGRRLRGAAYQYTLDDEFEVEAYIAQTAARAAEGVRRVGFDAASLVYLTRAEEYFDLERQFGSVGAAFEHVRARVLLVSHEGDWRFPPEEVEAMAAAGRAAGADVRHVVCRSAAGHGALRYDVPSYEPHVRELLGG